LIAVEAISTRRRDNGDLEYTGKTALNLYILVGEKLTAEIALYPGGSDGESRTTKIMSDMTNSRATLAGGEVVDLFLIHILCVGVETVGYRIYPGFEVGLTPI
jgi:hypothetical protein